MTLAAGTRLGPYEIIAAIGAGGMGEVYRAHDTRLHRDVAIKVLPELFAKDPERLERFNREAQVLASLNHPHIAHIHGIEESGGTLALVMELVDGETLADRIARGPIALDDAIPIARQIAEALEAAHDRGIIHRDLKPANIKVRPDGTVKVLDFGLAKALDVSGSSPGIDVMNSPTFTGRGAPTAAGVILGTAAYMSPEQARGKPADARSDIWAFGAVLYEMLTGIPLFAGATVSDILAAVLRDGPNWDALPPDTPPSVRRLLRRCLQKDPQSRLRHAADARLELVDSQDASDTAAPVSPAARKKDLRTHVIVPILAAIAAAVITPTIASYFRQPPRPPLRKFAIPKESANDSWVRENVPAISPDGSRVAYADGDRLRIRSLDALDALVVSGTGTAGLPTWSPDGRFIAYFIDHRTLWKVAAEGGNPQKICDLPPGLVFGLAWKPDRTIVVNMAYGPAAGELFTISENGGRPEKIRAPHLEEAAVFYLRGLPDGSLTYARIRKGERGETIFEEPGKAPKVLPIPRHSGVVYAPSGHLVYAGIETTGIWAVPFDRSSASVTGEPYRIADNGVGPTVSADGTLAYGRLIPGSRQLWWVDRDGTIRRPIGQPQDDMYEPALSPDGTRVAVVGVEKGASNIWLHDIGRAAKTRLTFDHEENPVWHPTEPRIAFRRQWDLFSLALDGRSEPVSVVATPVPEYWPQWSADGRYLLFGHYGQKTQGDIWMFEPGAKEPKPFLASPFNEAEFSFSRDGRHIAYISDETGRSEVFVRVSGGRRHSAAVIRRRRIPDMESPRRRGLLRRGSHVDVGVGAHAAVAAV